MVSARAQFYFNRRRRRAFVAFQKTIFRKALEVFRISSKDLLINEEIRDKEVRLVGVDGEQLGIVPIADAQNLAIEKNLDLVKIAPQAVPPVCKIMDYGKFKFEQAKRDKMCIRDR